MAAATAEKKTKKPAPDAGGDLPRQKFAAARKAMRTALVERDEEIDVVLTALLADEHPLLVGPPGTGKSLLLDSVMRWVDGSNRFNVLFTKFTTPEEVFGPISVNGLKEDKYRRVTTGKLPEAHFFFADEVFKAGSAILNTLLRVLNERVYENGDGQFARVPLQMCMGASNEWPGGDDGGRELGALFDRFLFRTTVSPVASTDGMKRLLWDVDADLLPDFDGDTLSLAELTAARKAVKRMQWEQGAMDAMHQIVGTLRQEGIRPGDRRLRKSVTAASAYAYLMGGQKVEGKHLSVLRHVLWEDPQEQPAVAAKVILRCADPDAYRVQELVAQAVQISQENEPAQALSKLQAVVRSLSALPTSEKQQNGLAAVNDMMKEIYSTVTGGGQMPTHSPAPGAKFAFSPPRKP